MSNFSDILKQLADGMHLSFDSAAAAFDAVMSGAQSPAEIAAFLMALRVRGETVNEIAAGAQILREHALKLADDHMLIDTCGTGGDGLDSYNISTASALVAAAAGARVAKHGNRSVSSKSGSSDVLMALGANLEIGIDAHKEALHRFGFSFLFAPKHHEAMRYVAPVRKELGLRTIFNLLGPLSNPAGAKGQVLGVYDAKWLEPMAQVLAKLGSSHVWVVHGHDGMDELSVTAKTSVVAMKNGHYSSFEIAPEDMGLKRHTMADLGGGDAAVNAAALRDVLNGAQNAYRDAVLLNAGAALVVADMTANLEHGVHLAKSAIDSGKAIELLDNWVAFTQAEGKNG